MDLRERGKQRRAARALEAARRILAQHGLAGLQMRAVAAGAELSVRTLYNHFGSKDEVLIALASDELDGLAQDLAERAIGDPLERSRAIITVSVARFDAERRVHRPLLAAACSTDLAPDGRLLFHQARALQEEALGAAIQARQLSPAVPARSLAHQVLASYLQAAQAWAQGGLDRAGFETQALHARACLLLGLARGAARTRLAEELALLEKPMAALVAEPSPRRRRARGS